MKIDKIKLNSNKPYCMSLLSKRDFLMIAPGTTHTVGLTGTYLLLIQIGTKKLYVWGDTSKGCIM
jgi:hypothetical protein